MDPDFSSLEPDRPKDEDGSFRPTQSATERMRHKRERDRRARQRAVRNILRYAGYVACIAFCAGLAQLVTGLYYGAPVGLCGWFFVHTFIGAYVGALVGFAIVGFFIVSPILPMGPVVVVRLEPHLASSDQEEAESKALLTAGILFALFGTMVAALTVITYKDRIHSINDIAIAGAIGAVAGALVVVVLVVMRFMQTRKPVDSLNQEG